MTLWEQILDDGRDLLWENLRKTEKTIVLYGTGNGADKILTVCQQMGICVQAVFASDGFRQGKRFWNMTVESRQAVFDRYGAENLIVLLAFASSRAEVLDTVRCLAETVALYAPDVPAVGDGLFDAAFARDHRAELLRARALLADAESRRIFDLTVAYKLTGKPQYLFDAVNDPAETLRDLVRPHALRAVLDLGAYNGDTVRKLLDTGATPNVVYAVEPDARTYRKLETYAESETRTRVVPICGAAWDRCEDLNFSAAGNRGAAVGGSKKTVAVSGLALDAVLPSDVRLDYVKFDVEGAERRALKGLKEHIKRDRPTLLVSIYHRNEDLFELPILLHERFGYETLTLRRFGGVPAWDLNLYARDQKEETV